MPSKRRMKRIVQLTSGSGVKFPVVGLPVDEAGSEVRLLLSYKPTNDRTVHLRTAVMTLDKDTAIEVSKLLMLGAGNAEKRWNRVGTA